MALFYGSQSKKIAFLWGSSRKEGHFCLCLTQLQRVKKPLDTNAENGFSWLLGTFGSLHRGASTVRSIVYCYCYLCFS